VPGSGMAPPAWEGAMASRVPAAAQPTTEVP
jgi:hypothetical protein